MSTPERLSRIGPYEVLDFLGKAGQSAVYKASEPVRGRTVAIKLFPARLSDDPALVERFHRELQAFVPVSRHPHLVEILATGQEGDQLFVVMELVDGTSLDRVLKERRLSVPEALTVLRGICRGLVQAHHHGLVHKSLTPRNVLISSDFDTVKLGDVVASGFESGPGLTGTVSTGEIQLAALYYLAPEQVDGSSQVDHRADIYSAGVILHQMLTGRTPGTSFGLPSQLNPELRPELDVVAFRCLARRPEERYATVIDLLDAVEKLEETLRLRLLTEIRDLSDAGSRLLERKSRLPLVVGIGAVLAALAAAAFLILS